MKFIDFPDQGVKIGLYVNKLAKNFNAELTQIFVYDKYPLLSVKNTKVSPHFLSIKKKKNAAVPTEAQWVKIQIAAAAWIQSPAQELPCAAGVAQNFLK